MSAPHRSATSGRRDADARAKAATKDDRGTDRSPRWGRGPYAFLACALAVVVALAASAILTNDKHGPTADPPLVGHVHGIAVESDGDVLLGAHFGVYKVSSQGGVELAGGRRSDTMALTSGGRGRLLASGHPDLTDPEAPVHAGLLESTDAAASWQAISLAGTADFHSLDYIAGRTWGIDSVTRRLLTSTDDSTWEEVPGPWLADLAVDPVEASRVVAVSPRGDLSIRNVSGLSRRLTGGPPLILLDWPQADRLVGVSESGELYLSQDAGGTWQRGVSLPGRPTALAADGAMSYVATDEGLYAVTEEGHARELASFKHS